MATKVVLSLDFNILIATQMNAAHPLRYCELTGIPGMKVRLVANKVDLEPTTDKEVIEEAQKSGRLLFGTSQNLSHATSRQDNRTMALLGALHERTESHSFSILPNLNSEPMSHHEP